MLRAQIVSLGPIFSGFLVVISDDVTNEPSGFQFKAYYNHQHVHGSLNGKMPNQVSVETIICYADFKQYRWQMHCRGLFDLPVAT